VFGGLFLCGEWGPFVGTFNLTTTSGAMLTVQPASDAEQVFDPFGFGFDSSDQIKFTGVIPVSSPEPSSVVLFARRIGLDGLWRKAFTTMTARGEKQ